MNTSSLSSRLLEATQDLRETFVAKSVDYAIREYNHAVVMSSYNDAQWCEYLGLIPVERCGRLTFPLNFYNTHHARTYSNALNKAKTTARQDINNYVARATADAEAYYKSSIDKLAFRIAAKGLNESQIEITSASVGVNFNCVVTDGNKVVRAWTIIAEGPIVRPHYRYLVK